MPNWKNKIKENIPHQILINEDFNFMYWYLFNCYFKIHNGNIELVGICYCSKFGLTAKKDLKIKEKFHPLYLLI